jgi:RIO-like serine/threonine protein kinase
MINRFDEMVLLKICRKTNMSPHSHVPAEAFKRGFPGKEDRAQDSLDKLIKLGYVQRHPRRGGMTYQISKEGRDLCRTLKEKGP